MWYEVSGRARLPFWGISKRWTDGRRAQKVYTQIYQDWDFHYLHMWVRRSIKTAYLDVLFRKNPRGVLISPGPGHCHIPISQWKKKCRESTFLTKRVSNFAFVIRRCTPRLGDIVAKCTRAWTDCTLVWCLHGVAMHWRGFWRYLRLIGYPNKHMKSYLRVSKSAQSNSLVLCFAW